MTNPYPVSATEQSLIAFQLLQYHILMPSLLISKRASECEDCPSKMENLRAAKLSNHLALNQLTQMVIGCLAASHYTERHKRDTASHPKEPETDDTTTTPTEPTITDTTTTEPTTTERTTTEPMATVPPVGQFPYVVSIQVTNFGSFHKHLCGGTLIAPSWVLTAYHCLEPERVGELGVLAGEEDLSRVEGTKKFIGVTEFFQHPGYVYHQGPPREHDLALVHLAEEIVETEFIKIAHLPTASLANPGAKCFEAGWGPRSENEPGTNIVKVSSIPILTKEDCESAYGHSIGENSICAGQEGMGACVGDNGGPLVCNSTLVAVMSWRHGCVRKGKPAVYMDVYKYLPWIHQVIETNT